MKTQIKVKTFNLKVIKICKRGVKWESLSYIYFKKMLNKLPLATKLVTYLATNIFLKQKSKNH